MGLTFHSIWGILYLYPIWGIKSSKGERITSTAERKKHERNTYRSNPQEGTFTDDNGKSIDYDNLVLQVQKPIENKLADDSNFVQGVGYTIANDCKCAWSERGNVFGKDVSMKDIGELVGTEIQYFYNDKKKLEAVII